MKTAILLGAGSSLPAGFPSTRCLTDLVLSGDGVRRHTDSSYIVDGAEPSGEESLLVNRMARRIHVEAERYHSTKTERQANYEDLFYLAYQAWAEEQGKIENPAPNRAELRIRQPCSSPKAMRKHRQLATRVRQGRQTAVEYCGHDVVLNWDVH